jgi:gluconate 2-dehydrogenase gamma chain
VAINRRQALQLLGSAPLAAGFAWTDAEAFQAQRQTQQARGAQTSFTPSFFTPSEYATVVMLSELIIPKDERSGGAIDAGVPEFIDFMMVDQPQRQLLIRGGIKWLDTECRRQFGDEFVDCTAAQQTTICDALAYPEKARPEHSHGARFFSAVRDLTATGFFTSKMGIDDLGYKGNTFVPKWEGAPQEALDHLGVSYDSVAKWYTEG